MGRVRRPFKRPSGKRDCNLIVIATEGRKTEPQYFEGLKKKYRNRKIHVEILEKDTNARSPEKVLSFLNEFKDEYTLKDNDELWMVIDFDRWGERKLAICNSKCKQKKYKMAVSNPCFELWLLLHIKNIDDYKSAEKEELLKNKKEGSSRTKLEKEILSIIGEYNKKNLPDKFLETNKIAIAIKQARKLNNPNADWPNSLGSKVFLLVEKLISNFGSNPA